MPSADVTVESVRSLAVDLSRYHEVATTTREEFGVSALILRDHLSDVVRIRRDNLTRAHRALDQATQAQAYQERLAAADGERNVDITLPHLSGYSAAVEQTERALERAIRAEQRVEQALDVSAAAVSEFLRATGVQIAGAQASLGRIERDLENYSSGTVWHVDSGPTNYISAFQGATDIVAQEIKAKSTDDRLRPPPAGVPTGITFVLLAEIDDSDSVITGPENFSKGYSVADLTWGHEALLDVVLPTLAAGGGIDQLRARDNAEGRQGTRSYADTFSGFFGGDAIKLAPDMTVTNGYHRIWVAKRMGLDSVPAKIE